MLHAQNLSYIHILYTQKGVYIIFEYKKNIEREAFRFSMNKVHKIEWKVGKIGIKESERQVMEVLQKMI